MTNPVRAREIMGKNFLGIEEVRQHFGVAYAEKQLHALADVPFGEDALLGRKHTHILFAGAPLSVSDIRTLAGGDFHETGWYRLAPFANETTVGVRWHLLRKEPVPGSHGKTYDRQAALLAKWEWVPFACEVTYMVILQWLTRGERLLSDVFVRCRDRDSDEGRVFVGGFAAGGFRVAECRENRRADYIGVASAVLPQKS